MAERMEIDIADDKGNNVEKGLKFKSADVV